MGAFKNTFQLNDSHTFYCLFAWFSFHFLCVVCAGFFVPRDYSASLSVYFYLFPKIVNVTETFYYLCIYNLSCTTPSYTFGNKIFIGIFGSRYCLTNIDLLFMTICDVFLLFLIFGASVYGALPFFIYRAPRG